MVESGRGRGEPLNRGEHKTAYHAAVSNMRTPSVYYYMPAVAHNTMREAWLCRPKLPKVAREKEARST